MLDLRRLRLLREFAGRGTIAATAAALGYTPSAVSQQLATLEREAGVILLDRTARSAELTDAGTRLAAHAERILALVEEAESDLSAQERAPSRRVRVRSGCPATLALRAGLRGRLPHRRGRLRPGPGPQPAGAPEPDPAAAPDPAGRRAQPGPLGRGRGRSGR